ncbi:hypothetical protein HanIR_Chr14g0724601 [Helianthus annuus]|nr:hypothetical protein HanIR_Chr14g0724601 [Helianthus annuus]
MLRRPPMVGNRRRAACRGPTVVGGMAYDGRRRWGFVCEEDDRRWSRAAGGRRRQLKVRRMAEGGDDVE